MFFVPNSPDTATAAYRIVYCVSSGKKYALIAVTDDTLNKTKHLNFRQLTRICSELSQVKLGALWAQLCQGESVREY